MIFKDSAHHVVAAIHRALAIGHWEQDISLPLMCVQSGYSR
jgi:hypothetical protein